MSGTSSSKSSRRLARLLQPLRQRGLGLRLVTKPPAPPAPDAPDARERPPLPVRLPGQALRRRAKAAPGSLVTVRALHRVEPAPRRGDHDVLSTLTFLGPDEMVPLNVHADGSVCAVPSCLNKRLPTFLTVAELEAAHPAELPLVVRALEARRAALVGRSDLVEAFATDVIGLRRGTRWQEAASTALLGNDWLEPLDHGKQLDGAALARLRAEILALHRQLTPVWRRRTRHGRVLLLNTPVSEGITVQDLVAEKPDTTPTPLDVTPENARLAALIRRLLPAERAVALAWAHPGVRTWADAAQEAGADDPTVVGERVRRKVRRLVAERQRRDDLRGRGSA
ncbi:hypothetical protein SNOUR_38120 [Streptomyces noursei ATCC 11455]|nr:hypothetical protein SNOUR_38120 [Streptomyces noursei ATCC 11455]